MGKTFRPSRGFTLVELAIALLIVSLTFLFLLGPSTTMLNLDKRRATATKLSALEQSITLFVMQQKRLPCPADGTLDSAVGGAGKELAREVDGRCPGSQQNGVVPWVTLGLTPADAEDGWYNRITYRVDSPGLTVDYALNLTECDPAGAADAELPGSSSTSAYCRSDRDCFTSGSPSSCTRLTLVLNGKGLDVRDSGGSVLMDKNGGPGSEKNYTGAAYVLISHGEAGGGGFPSGGGTVIAGTAGTEEARNYASLPLQAYSYYVDGPQNYNLDATGHFDDIVVRPTVMTVVARAKLEPRPR